MARVRSRPKVFLRKNSSVCAWRTSRDIQSQHEDRFPRNLSTAVLASFLLRGTMRALGSPGAAAAASSRRGAAAQAAHQENFSAFKILSAMNGRRATCGSSPEDPILAGKITGAVLLVISAAEITADYRRRAIIASPEAHCLRVRRRFCLLLARALAPPRGPQQENAQTDRRSGSPKQTCLAVPYDSFVPFALKARVFQPRVRTFDLQPVNRRCLHDKRTLLSRF